MGRTAALTLALAMLAPALAGAAAFDFDRVIDRARKLAEQPYQEPPAAPEALRQFDYDQYRDIEFRADKALWPDNNFHVQFFAPGYLFTHPVAMHVVEGGQVRDISFSTELFDFGDTPIPENLPEHVGFAGFRLHYTPFRPERFVAAKNNEVVAFLGASYYRGKGESQVYGLSARGMALNTLSPGPEEFPRFSEFWLLKPEPDATAMTVYALLESPSATGAYRFVIKPGKDTVTRVDSVLFLRKPVDQLGLAPLTSMHMYSVGAHRPPIYMRPAVHDSQGLLIQTADRDWTWRPLANPESITEHRFQLTDPRGFGLMQRDREFDHYQSISMAYQDRPSAWVEPLNGWGAGHVTLIQLPTANETQDNIVAFWTPAQQPAPGEPLRLSYRLHWSVDGPPRNVATVVGTRMTERSLTGPTLFMVDFAGGPLTDLAADAPVESVIDIGENGKVDYSYLTRNTHTGGWRLVFRVLPSTGQPVQLRAYLTHDGRALTETWDYVLAP